MRQYQPIRSELAITDGITMEGKGILIPLQLQKLILKQPYGNKRNKDLRI